MNNPTTKNVRTKRIDKGRFCQKNLLLKYKNTSVARDVV
jgi:hypothetical protein